MKTKPILFSGPMVRAIVSGQKSQTRRIIKPQPKNRPILANAYTVGADRSKDGNEWLDADCINPGVPMKTPFVVGQRLWVRETFAIENTHEYDGTETLPTDGRPIQRREGFKLIPRYRATEPDTQLIIAECEHDEDAMRWTASSFMPRWASRITLEIESVRVERLQDISFQDALAEGLAQRPHRYLRCQTFGVADWEEERWRMSPIDAYEALWGSINGKGSWATNPWVWVITFRRIAATKAGRPEEG